MDDRYVTLYNKDKKPILMVRLSEEGHKKYKRGDKWDFSWVEIMLDITRILKAEF